MATPFVDRLQSELAELDALYEREFAGQARATRDVSILEDMIRRVDDVLARIDQIPAVAQGRELAEGRSSAVAMRATYVEERKQIERAKLASPAQEAFGVLAAKANFTFARYARHFAGQGRESRDVALLAEMISDLEGIETKMVDIRKKERDAVYDRDIEVVRGNLKMYKAERQEIEKAQSSGTLEQRAGMLGGLANGQFAIYMEQFANKSRITRRPALLARVIASLAGIESKMRAISAQNFFVDWHAKNIEVVEERRKAYEAELIAIRDARKETPVADIMGMLGEAANQLFADYGSNFAGKSRTDVDEKILSVICDGLGDVATQMDELARIENNATNTQNLDIVRTNHAAYEQEWLAIKRAKGVNV
jgi:hypothetical protein